MNGIGAIACARCGRELLSAPAATVNVNYWVPMSGHSSRTTYYCNTCAAIVLAGLIERPRLPGSETPIPDDEKDENRGSGASAAAPATVMH